MDYVKARANLLQLLENKEAVFFTELNDSPNHSDLPHDKQEITRKSIKNRIQMLPPLQSAEDAISKIYRSPSEFLLAWNQLETFKSFVRTLYKLAHAVIQADDPYNELYMQRLPVSDEDGDHFDSKQVKWLLQKVWTEGNVGQFRARYEAIRAPLQFLLFSDNTLKTFESFPMFVPDNTEDEKFNNVPYGYVSSQFVKRDLLNSMSEFDIDFVDEDEKWEVWQTLKDGLGKSGLPPNVQKDINGLNSLTAAVYMATSEYAFLKLEKHISSNHFLPNYPALLPDQRWAPFMASTLGPTYDPPASPQDSWLKVAIPLGLFAALVIGRKAL